MPYQTLLLTEVNIKKALEMSQLFTADTHVGKNGRTL